MYNTAIGKCSNIGINSGTSFAAPQVSSVAALLLSINPNLTSEQVRKATFCHTATNYQVIVFSNNSSHPNDTWNNNVDMVYLMPV